jgi:hypothetical protein
MEPELKTSLSRTQFVKQKMSAKSTGSQLSEHQAEAKLVTIKRSEGGKKRFFLDGEWNHTVTADTYINKSLNADRIRPGFDDDLASFRRQHRIGAEDCARQSLFNLSPVRLQHRLRVMTQNSRRSSWSLPFSRDFLHNVFYGFSQIGGPPLLSRWTTIFAQLKEQPPCAINASAHWVVVLLTDRVRELHEIKPHANGL